MKAFISYSHKDDSILEMLHKHLAQLRRENLITEWTDKEISAGANLDQNISIALMSSDLFIALLSPDYIASNYCYEKEFEKALEMQGQGKIIIVPLIVEPCDWLNTPFKQFKALPKDGKEISTWENKNTAFLDVIQNIRRLVTSSVTTSVLPLSLSTPIATRNYRVQKDFDSIEKMEFVEKSFHEIKEYLKRYIEEVLTIDGIKAMVTIDTSKDFECILVNRNKIATESKLNFSITKDKSGFNVSRSSIEEMSYVIDNSKRPIETSFSLSFDEYHLFWIKGSMYSNSRHNGEISMKQIADLIWNEWLESVGIL